MGQEEAVDMLKNLKLSPAIIIGLLVLAGIVFFLSRCGGNQQVPVTGMETGAHVCRQP